MNDKDYKKLQSLFTKRNKNKKYNIIILATEKNKKIYFSVDEYIQVFMGIFGHDVIQAEQALTILFFANKDVKVCTVNNYNQLDLIVQDLEEENIEYKLEEIQ